jgi:hypothetical protein
VYITNGDKVKYAYLKKNPLRFDVMCLKGFDDPDEVDALIKQYIDYDKIFESQLKNKLQDFYDAMDWGTINDNEFSQEFFSF